MEQKNYKKRNRHSKKSEKLNINLLPMEILLQILNNLGTKDYFSFLFTCKIFFEPLLEEYKKLEADLRDLLFDLVSKNECLLFGGAIRYLILGIMPRDYDFLFTDDLKKKNLIENLNFTKGIKFILLPSSKKNPFTKKVTIWKPSGVIESDYELSLLTKRK